MNHQGKATSAPVGQKLYSREMLSQESGESHSQIQRYIRLTYLVPELLEFVDEGRIKMRPAVELSYLDEDAQRDIVEEIDLNDCTPSHAQTTKDFMRQIDRALAISIGLTRKSRKKTFEACLCPTCLNNFFETHNYIIRRIDKFQTEKDTCTYCQQRLGYDYRIIDRKERKDNDSNS